MNALYTHCNKMLFLRDQNLVIHVFRGRYQIGCDIALVNEDQDLADRDQDLAIHFDDQKLAIDGREEDTNLANQTWLW